MAYSAAYAIHKLLPETTSLRSSVNKTKAYEIQGHGFKKMSSPNNDVLQDRDTFPHGLSDRETKAFTVTVLDDNG